MSQPKSPVISVVVPVYNEEEVILTSIEALEIVLQDMGVPFEIIVVDDGSNDETLSKVIEHSKEVAGLRTIALPRNLGHMYAITSGLEASRGNFVVTIDADMQDPPIYIQEMYQIAISDPSVEVVQAVRIDRSSDSTFKRFTARIYYKFASAMSGFEVVKDGADFRLMNRKVVNLLTSLPERNRIYRLLIPYFGFETRYIKIKRDKRFAGKTKYSLSKMLSLTMDSFLNFSNKPLKIFTKMGLFSSLLFFTLSLLSILLWAVGDGGLIPGWTSLVFIILFSNGLLLTALGLVGEYVGRIYIQVQNRPRITWKEISKLED